MAAQTQTSFEMISGDMGEPCGLNVFQFFTLNFVIAVDSDNKKDICVLQLIQAALSKALRRHSPLEAAPQPRQREI